MDLAESIHTNTTTKLWHISSEGDDRPNCGNLHNPCKSLENITTSESQHGEIHLQASEHHIYAACTKIRFRPIQSLVISGENDLEGTKIGCTHSDKNHHPSWFNTKLEIIGTGNKTNVILKDLVFIRADISIINCDVTIENCRFYSSRLKIYVNESNRDLTIRDTKWTGFTYCEDDQCSPSGEIKIMGYLRHVNITSNIFSHTNLTAQFQENCIVILDQNQLTNDKTELPVENSIFIMLATVANSSSITVQNSIFEHQYHWNPVESVMNIFEASLLVRLLVPQGVRPLDIINNISIFIDNCTYYNNERAVTFQGPIESIHIRNSTFKSNIAMHAGAGILLLTEKKMLIENSTFESNAAGRFRSENVRPPGDYFKVDGDEAYVFSTCCKGSISLIGKGGAIRIQKGNVVLSGCRFINNTATILGGSIFVDRNYALTIEDTDFMNAHDIAHAAQQGDVIYSNGKVEISGARFNVITAANHISLLQHSGDHWSIGVYDISIECPVGYRLRIMNASAYQVMPHQGLMRSYMLDQLAYFCESCPRYKYSLERGYFYYQMDIGVPGYFTLMINGENPNSEFQGTYKYEDIVCKECPYGGNCDNDQLKSLPNFWGYEYNGEVKFQLCPKGYCCSLKSCPTYNTCARYRTGRLCAECITGYSEALFSPKCIPNTLCGPIWIWFLPAGMGFLYGLLLFFQKDIRDFIFAIPSVACFKENKTSESDIENDAKSAEEKQWCLEPAVNNDDKDKFIPAKKEFTYRDDMDTTTNNTNKNNIPEIGIIQNGTSQKQEHVEDIASPAFDNYGRIITRPSDKDEHNEIEADENEEEEAAPSSANDFGAIMLITILYYFQDAQLLHVKTAFAAEENPKWSMIKAILLGLFKFRIEIAHFLDAVCLVEGLTPSIKLMAKTLLVPYVLTLFGLLYFVYSIYDKLCSTKSNNTPKRDIVESEEGEKKGEENTFLSRLAMGFMLALLFTYQMLATTAFKLLNCVPVGNDSVLFIDGVVSCYQPWQYGVLIYAMTCIVPFSFVLMLGPGLLQEGRISLPTFFTACIFPFPYVLSWLLLRTCKRNYILAKNDKYPTEPGKVVIKVLQGPFKDIENKITGPVCWAGVLIFRRLLLVLLYTFINISLLRLISMLLVCFIVLLNQVHVKPYRDSRANVAGSASIAALMFVGGINLVRSAFEAAEYTPHGPYKLLIIIMQETENTLMLWIPLVFMVIMGLILSIKICAYLITLLSNWCNAGSSSESKKR